MSTGEAAIATELLWGVGSYEGGTTREPWEISQGEIQREIGAAPRRLEALGLTGGTRVLLCSMLSEAGQFWPLTIGAMLTGAQLSCADANEGDAVRVAMFLRLVEYRAVLGITGAILDGLDALDRTYEEVFGSVPVLGARPDAYARLVGRGLAPHHFVLCGPAVAIGSAPGAPARVDTDEWRLDLEGDRVTVTNLEPRAATFDHAPTAIRGALDDDGLVPLTSPLTS